MASLTTLDLLRHGTPEGGPRYRGQIDDPLSERGWAELWAAVDGEHAWQRVVSSPLLRCRAFAERLAKQREIPLTLDERLMEVGFGVWEGRTAADIEAGDPGAIARFRADPVRHRPEAAEELSCFVARVTAALDTIVARHAGEHLLLVVHAGVVRAALAQALALPESHLYRVRVDTASLTRVRIPPGGVPEVAFCNRVRGC